MLNKRAAMAGIGAFGLTVIAGCSLGLNFLPKDALEREIFMAATQVVAAYHGESETFVPSDFFDLETYLELKAGLLKSEGGCTDWLAEGVPGLWHVVHAKHCDPLRAGEEFVDVNGVTWKHTDKPECAATYVGIPGTDESVFVTTDSCMKPNVEGAIKPDALEWSEQLPTPGDRLLTLGWPGYETDLLVAQECIAAGKYAFYLPDGNVERGIQCNGVGAAGGRSGGPVAGIDGKVVGGQSRGNADYYQVATLEGLGDAVKKIDNMYRESGLVGGVE